MSNWVHNLPVLWMALVVFGGTYLVTAAIYAVIILLARGERARAFKAVSPGMLPPLGILFGLFVAFTAAQVWNDNERAEAAVNREASALRAILMLAASLPGEVEAQIRVVIGRHIEEAATREWPMMAQQTVTLGITPRPLAETLRLVLALTPTDKGKETAQRELVTALENALDARRQRIIVSQSEVNPVKWSCLFVQAVCALLAMGMVHSDNRLAAAITMGIFATGVATSVLLIAAHDRPFTGELSVGPDLLLQIMPGAESS
jgi:Protein of unknown function (DUF4239)